MMQHNETGAPAQEAAPTWIMLDDSRVVPLTPNIGAEIRGIDVSAGVSDADMTLIRDALHRFSVIVLRDQKLAPRDQIGLAGRLGPLRVSFMTQLAPEGHVELTTVSNIVRDGKPIGLVDAGALWHTDGSYLAVPDMYTALYSLEIPQRDGEVLGDTLFASTAAAYDELPLEVKRRIAGRKAFHSLVHHVQKKSEAKFKVPPVTDAQRAAMPEVAHPVVRTHPVTGRKCIYATEGHTRAIADMPEAESDELLRLLCAHVTKPEFVYRHKWRVGDLLFWDNCSAQHLAVTDYGDIPRRLHRAGIAGPPPV